MSHIENIEKSIECLSSALDSELSKGIEYADCKEIGEVADMIKDLNTGLYYAKIVKSMKDAEKEDEMLSKLGMPDERRGYNGKNKMVQNRRMIEDMTPYVSYRDMNRMYYDGARSGSMNNSNMTSNNINRSYESQYDRSRRMYEESKINGNDSKTNMQNLEEYMKTITSELSNFVNRMDDNEKSLVKSKLQNLATKIM